MTRPGQNLAARFKRAVDASEAKRHREEEERMRQQEVGREARKELFADLGEFGKAIGHIQVQAKSHDNGITLSFRDRFLHFVPMGDAERVQVTFAGADNEEHRLYREPQLGHRWIWKYRRAGREERMPLFDAGLEELVVRALGLPPPDSSIESEPVPATTLEDILPKTS